jgi:hypothetical protein
VIDLPDRGSLRATPAAFEKLSLYIRLAEGEVGGLASVEQDGPATFLMTDCFLIRQRATDVDNELDPAATSVFLLNYLATGEDPSGLRLWWHSHGRESAFWSADDERTIDHFGGEWLVSLVGNKRGKFLARFDRYEPARQTLGWLDFTPPCPPPAEDGPAAQRARIELAERVHVVRRATNKPWTDADLPHRHG